MATTESTICGVVSDIGEEGTEVAHLGEIFETGWENEDVGRDVQFEKLVVADVQVDVGRHIRRRRNDGIHPVGMMSDLAKVPVP